MLTLSSVFFILLFSLISCQQQENPLVDPNVLEDIFGRPNVSSTTVAGAPLIIGSLGQGAGDCICVPYHNCDENRVLKLDGEVDGFGLIDIRFGKSKCEHYLDLCCTYPENYQPTNPIDPIVPDPDPVDPGPDPVNPVRPPVTDRPVTRPPVTPPVIPETPPPTLPPLEKVRCGIRNENGIEFNIIGNNDREAEYGEFPWMIAVLKNNWVPSSDENLALCGGSLINPLVVLTGAHCVFNYTFNPTDLKIRAGEWDTQTTKERYPYQEQNVAQIIIHENYNPKNLNNDIALLVLESPVTYAANVKPVCLPEHGTVFHDKECYASGWGKTHFGKKGSRAVILKKIDLPIVPKPQCENALRATRLGKHFSLHPSFICAGGISGKDTCTGDGGSPLVCPDRSHPGRYVQSGVVAWGIGCGEDGIPGVYVNVAGFRRWIDQKMDQLFLDSSSYKE